MSYWANYDDGNVINNMLVKNQYSHIHISSESSEKFILRNTGKFKNFSGGDLIEARPAFGKLIKYKSGLPILLTNNLPEFKTTSNIQSLERRILVFRLPYYFASEDKIDYNNPSHKLRDTSLEEKFSFDINYSKALFWILQLFPTWTPDPIYTLRPITQSIPIFTPSLI
jgi:phage/plasmid-associated DNA primase